MFHKNSMFPALLQCSIQYGTTSGKSALLKVCCIPNRYFG